MPALHSFIPPTALQFAKYIMCGLTALIVHWIIVNILGHTLFPAFEDALGDDLRFKNSAIGNSIAFIFSNTVAYILNVRFVFRSGRHNRRTEILLFFLAAGLAFFPALLSLNLIIRTFSLNTYIANIGFPVTAAAMNFIIRKFLIFK